MFSITDPDDLDDLVRFSATLFARHGLAVDVSGILDEESAAMSERVICDGFTNTLTLPQATWQHDLWPS